MWSEMLGREDEDGGEDREVGGAERDSWNGSGACAEEKREEKKRGERAAIHIASSSPAGTRKAVSRDFNQIHHHWTIQSVLLRTIPTWTGSLAQSSNPRLLLSACCFPGWGTLSRHWSMFNCVFRRRSLPRASPHPQCPLPSSPGSCPFSLSQPIEEPRVQVSLAGHSSLRLSASHSSVPSRPLLLGAS